MKNIQYGIDGETGLIISKTDDNIAWPVLDFAGMKPENNWKMNYNLKKFKIVDVGQSIKYVKWTRKIPNEIKNMHRQFWGFKLLTGKNRWEAKYYDNKNSNSRL